MITIIGVFGLLHLEIIVLSNLSLTVVLTNVELASNGFNGSSIIIAPPKPSYPTIPAPKPVIAPPEDVA